MFKDDFTVDEWRTLQFAPFWVFTAVAAVEGGIDKKESEALAKEITEASLFKDALVREVLESVRADIDQTMQAFAADGRDVLKGLTDVADVLDRRATPEQVRNFKGAMLMIGNNVAEASGGGLFHRKKVSDKEKVAIVAAAVAMRTEV